MQLRDEYVIDIIYETVNRPKHIKGSNIYNFECPLCNEGKSRGKKRRGFFIPSQSIICCHNCEWQSRPFKWIQAVTNKSYEEIKRENGAFVSDVDDIVKIDFKDTKSFVSHTLPRDSINLYNDTEVEYYKENAGVTKAMKYLQGRRLYSAKYRPKAVYTTINDPYYLDSICFPFYDINNKLEFFQVRELDNRKEPKYRGKYDSDKTVFNIDRIDQQLPYIFIFEGPIDSMFVKNGVAIAGTKMTAKQTSMLNMFPLHKRIWVPDNQQVDETSAKITNKLLKEGQSVFIWPKKYDKFKDVNDLCCHYKIDELGTKFILDNTRDSLLNGILG